VKKESIGLLRAIYAVKSILPEIWRFKYRVVVGILFVLISYILVISPPLLLSYAIDYLVDNDIKKVIFFTILMMAISAVALFCVPAQSRYMADLEQRILDHLMHKWLSRILAKSFRSLSSLKEGGLLNSFHRGWAAYEGLLKFIFSTFTPACVEIVLISGYFIYRGLVPLLVSLVILSIAFVWVVYKSLQWRLPSIQKAMDLEDAMSSSRGDILKSGRYLKLANNISFASLYLKKSYKNFVGINTDYFVKEVSLYSIKNGFSSISCAIVLLVGVYWLSHNQDSQLTPGVFAVLYFYSSRLMQQVSTLINGIQGLSDFSESQKAIQQLIELPNQRDHLPLLKQKDIIFHNPIVKLSPFDFVLNKEKNVYLKNTSVIHLSHHHNIAITGASGQGKTSLAELIAGVECHTDTVYISGADLGCIDEKTIRENIYLCESDPVFLHGNLVQALAIPYNIMLSHEDLGYFFEILYLDQFKYLMDKDKEFPTQSLSSGEKKRFSIMRAMLLNRPITILDEPTEALNKDLIKKIWDNIFKYFSDKMLIALTHDSEIFSQFDQVIDIKNHTLREL